jgi:hypothetical protein
MGATNVSERVKLCAARSLGLAENKNDAIVLIDSLLASGVIDVEIPEQSILKSISGEEFILLLTKALVQFDDDGSWIDLTREEVEARGGIVDDLRDGHVVFYRIENPDGTIPSPPTLSSSGDRVVLFHAMRG